MKIVRRELEGFVNGKFVESDIKYRFEITDIGDFGVLFEIRPLDRTQEYFNAIELASQLIDRFQLESSKDLV